MTRLLLGRLAASVAFLGVGTAALAAQAPSPAAAASEARAIAEARADSARLPYTRADIDFMSGMIAHHAQAIVISGWVATHGSNPSVRTLAARIINAQRDEIRTMQQWLRDRQLPVPQPDTTVALAMMPGMHGPMMPGMLGAAQLARLDSARGADFDRLLLQDMIQHHRGAVSMVDELFNTYGAAQDQTVFKLASNISADQLTEIARMQRMLAGLLFDGADR